jgi:hypothetical protein
VRNTLGTVNSIYTLVGGSAKRQAIFENIQKQHLEIPNPKTLKSGCDPRWGSKKGHFFYFNSYDFECFSQLSLNNSSKQF